MLERPLRIAVFSDSCLPILNGVSISIDLLVRELRNQGHSVHIYTAAHFKHKDSDPNIFRFPAVETPWTKNYPLAFPPFFPMLRRFRQNTYDVIHTHTPFTIGFVGLRWAQSHEIPIVATYHTLYDRYAHYIPAPRRYVRYKIAKHTHFYYNRVDQIITPSEAAAKWLKRHEVDRPVHVIPTGAPSRAFLDRAEARLALGFAPHHRVLLYVGRLAREKNLELLFESVALAFAEEPNARLVVVGDGPHREACVTMARRLGIGDRVQFAGFVPREDVDRFYAAADLFVFASVTETQGLVIQEAMTHGLPAIAVVGGGASATIVDGVNGFVTKNSVSDLSLAIGDVLRDSDLLDRLAHGATKSTKVHTVIDMASQVVGVYRIAIGLTAPSAHALAETTESSLPTP